ncbi:MAG: hypothetical protein OHK0056_03900 [Bacteriovoracaceae bacterium]
MFVHEKGTKSVRVFSASRDNDQYPSLIHFDSYKKITSFIKSKRSKNEGSISLEQFSLNGQFIHASVTTKLYDILILLNKDEFLPFDRSEVDFLQTIKAFSYPLLEEMSQKYKKNLFQPMILNSLMSSNVRFAVVNRSDLVIFKNFLENISLDEFRKNASLWKLSSSLTLVVQDQNTNQKVSDLSHYQRISFLGELLNTLKHELSNPLFGLSLATDALMDDLSHEKETLNDIKISIHRASEIIKGFSSLYESSENFISFSVNKVLKETLTLCKSELKGIKRIIEIDDTDEIFIQSNPIWLSQIIFNLIINSAQALKDCSTQSPQIKIKMFRSNGSTAHIEICDNGPGISKENLKRIFDPFFTTKQSGTGLGLPICKSLCDRLGFGIEIESNPGEGTKASLSFVMETN